MIVLFGLVLLIAAVVAGVAGVLANAGHAHGAGHFAVFGYHVTGSTGTLFLYGIVVGALAVFGLSVLLAGARRTSRRGRMARRGLRQSRRETAAVSQDRDDLIEQRDTARAYTASKLGSGDPGAAGSSPRWLGLFGRRPGPAVLQSRAAQPDAVTVQPAAGVPAESSRSVPDAANAPHNDPERGAP